MDMRKILDHMELTVKWAIEAYDEEDNFALEYEIDVLSASLESLREELCNPKSDK
jgi:hypothetical protein